MSSPRFFPASSLLPLSAALAALAPAPVSANERSFTYTYESATLPEGAHELELWTTARLGREGGAFRRYDQRLEVEAGLTDRLLGSVYINAESVHAKDEATGAESTESGLTGASLELKYKHLDAAADAVGLASYLELSAGPDEAEIEVKLIVDKQLDALILAANLVFEEEIEDFGGENELEHVFELDLGAAYELGEHVSLGAEVRGTGVIAEGELEGVALYAGPALSLRAKGAWATLTVAPQVGAFGGELSGFERDLEHNEKLQVRLLTGFDF